MNRAQCTAMLLAPLLLAGCTTDSLEGERTVFHNAYAPTALKPEGIGPQCETNARASDATCLGVPLTRKGRGNAIGVPLSEGPRLTRAQRRQLRERAELLEALRQQPPPSTAEPAP